MINNTIRISILTILFAGVISLGAVFLLKTVYAHTFSGSESAAFLALVKILQADLHLVQSNIASNVTLAQAHANAVAEHLDANTTKELAERNKLVANELTKATADLNQTVITKPIPTQELVKGNVDRTDALLQEAITVRVEKNELNNSTVKGQAIGDIVDEALERYRKAYGIEEGNSAAGGGNTIVNMADYQSAQAIVTKAQEMFNEAKQIVPANASASSPSTLAVITKLGSNLAMLKNDIDTKVPYDKVATFVNSTITPDLKSAFKF